MNNPQLFLSKGKKDVSLTRVKMVDFAMRVLQLVITDANVPNHIKGRIAKVRARVDLGHKAWIKLTSENLHESFIISRVLIFIFQSRSHQCL